MISDIKYNSTRISNFFLSLHLKGVLIAYFHQFPQAFLLQPNRVYTVCSKVELILTSD